MTVDETFNSLITTLSRGCAVDPGGDCIYIHVEKGQDVHPYLIK